MNANEALIFEDSPNGIAAARAAGIFVVAVPNRLTSGLDLSGANLRMASMDEESLEWIIKRVEEQVAI